MKTSLAIAITMAYCLGNTPLPAQTHYAFHPENKEYLQYFCVANSFDSSIVQYRFGEVALVHNGATTRVFLAPTVALHQKISGADNQGEDLVLRTAAKTQDFTLTGGATVSYFGELQAFRTPCNGVDTQPGEGPNQPVASWGILDRSEFVVELVRASDSTRLAVLDSVGVHPPEANAPPTDTRYGTNPQQVVKHYAIPQALDGVEAYIRISPRRYGPTPYGMELCKQDNWVNYSAYYNSAKTAFISAEAYQALSDQCFQAFLTYCDSVQATTGQLPPADNFGFSSAEMATFRARYLEPIVDSATGRQYWRQRKTSAPQKVAAHKYATDAYQVDPADAIYPATEPAISPMPAAPRSTIRLTLKSLQKNAINLRLFSSSGQAMSVLWAGELQAGDNAISITLPDLAAGFYRIAIERYNGKRLRTIPLIIEK